MRLAEQGLLADMETRRRRLSGALIRHAASVMPSSLRHWADAMRNELAHMADDREALRWAIGCLAAAHVARIRGLWLLDVPTWCMDPVPSLSRESCCRGARRPRC
jgi:hypothetical protein